MLRSEAMSELVAAIKRAGGLYSRAGLARSKNVSKAYVSEVTARDDFPEAIPIDDGKREVWVGAEIDHWWTTPRKPGPKP